MSDRSGRIQTFSFVGAVGAAALSWAKFHSVGWAIWAALMGWGYIAYYIFRYMIL